jgi:hypothetical protein
VSRRRPNVESELVFCFKGPPKGRRRAAKKQPKRGRRKAVAKEHGEEVPESDDLRDEDLRALLRQLQKDIRKHRGSCDEREFRRMVDHLQTMCPPPKRCRVSVKRLGPEEMTEEYGYVLKERDKFEIYIAKGLTEYETEHVLLHEWAHMLAWQPYHPLMGDHSANWGVWYSLVWRKYHACE